MAKKLLTLGSVALALLLVSAVATPADARRGGHHGGGHHGGGHHGGGHHGGGHHFGGHHFGGHHFRPHAHSGHRRHFRHHHGRFLLGAPLLYGGYSYYSGDCAWLRRRALHSGSPYWWDRYYACVYGDGY